MSSGHTAFINVGVTGFEPATTWSQTRCATGLRYAPKTLTALFCQSDAKVRIISNMHKFFMKIQFVKLM